VLAPCPALERLESGDWSVVKNTMGEWGIQYAECQLKQKVVVECYKESTKFQRSSEN